MLLYEIKNIFIKAKNTNEIKKNKNKTKYNYQLLLFRMVLDFSTLNRMYWVKYDIYFPVGLRNRFVCYIKVQ